MYLTDLLSDLSTIFYPRLCHVCNLPLGRDERFVCELCLSSFTRTLFEVLPLNPMELRFKGVVTIEKATALFYYVADSPLSQLIQDFKYRRLPEVARMFGNLAADKIFYSGFFSDIDFIIPVPIHFTKRLRRGYNQTEYLARGLSEVLHIPWCTDLKAIRPHATQTRKNAEERKKNTQGIFRLRNPKKYDAKHILLVDDVCTTGSTLSSAAQTILAQMPGCRISIFTLAVTLSPHTDDYGLV